LRVSEMSARALVGETDRLMRRLPQCFSKVPEGEAPLWQARKVAQECDKLTVEGHGQVDDAVAPALGVVGPFRLLTLVEAALQVADPEGARLRVDRASERFVKMRSDRNDPLSSKLTARLDTADAIYLDAMVQLIADKFQADGDDTSNDQRRAKGLGVLSNPAAAVTMVGMPSTRLPSALQQLSVILPGAEREAGPAAFITRCAELVPAFTPRTQVYVHMFAGSLNSDDAITRVEGVGPVLAGHVARITKGCHVKVTPVIHLDGSTIGVDQYEIPAKIRRQVLLRQPYDVFPWSSIESRHLDLDHTAPYVNGAPNQTRTDNLGPLSRRAHRVKTHAGWRLKQPSPGVFLWQTGAGQQVQVDNTGAHPVRRL